MLIKSVGVTFSILRAFVGRRSALTLKEIGYQAGLPASKAHRYLQSLIREGMITQDPRTRQYRLGPAAIDLGLEALENNDPVVNACEAVRPLAAAHDIAIGIDVLGPNGPICIWYEQPATPLTTAARLGGTQPLLESAAGHVFLAFVPRHVTRVQVVAECRQAALAGVDPDRIAYHVKTKAHAALPAGGGNAGATIAAPILDARGEACAAITFYLRDQNGAGDDLVLTLMRAAADASAFKLMTTQPRLAEAV
ncbi:IclR family transcriptional regulator [Pararhizobium haloflavum]|uniref:IclR family transcriptional regulator n=1 Tax=Pararhizobium haloflavum TaxID=2037914 RepID=UPI000C17BEF0|nr:helix-turn-helix domain-containing protein [Pararhizobium haloflavum]